MLKQTLRTMVAFGLAGMLALGSAPGMAQADGTYQLGCYPYGTPDFGFGQYINGWGYHVAEDVCHEAGIPVYAASAGTVVYSAQTEPSARWGNLIIIEHANPDGNRVVSLYGHLNSDRRVSAGQGVTKGQRIGTVGPRGNVNGNWDPHLHFGIHPGGYGAPVGSYASWVHGYETPCCGGWVPPNQYVSARIAGYDHVPYDIVGQNATVFNNGQAQIVFRVRNTGSFTWRKDGNSSTPVRLGTTGPYDRASGFSGNGTATGWVGNNRIKLDNDTASGGLASFTATFKSPGVPGTYLECFNPVIEGAGWMPERQICAFVTVLPPQYRGEWYNQMITTNFDPTNLGGQTNAQYLLPGEKRNLKLFVKNVGEMPWTTGGSDYVRLATSRNYDRSSPWATGGDGSIPTSENWSWYNRPSEIDGRYDPGSNTVVADTSITTGEIAVFSYAVTAPQQAGNYQEYFNPVAEGHYHFADLGMWFDLRVADQGYHYQYVTQNASPSSIGQTDTVQDVTLHVRNSGREAWPIGGDVRLATDRPIDNQPIWYTPSGTGAWASPNRPSTVDRNVTTNATSGSVNPGEVAEFSFRLSVPTTLDPGTYKLYVRPVKDGVAFFPEDYGIHFPISITVPPYKHQVTYQAFSGNPNSFPRNSTMTANLGVKNLGRATWDAGGSNPVRLGTERPKDRPGGFADFVASDPWLSSSRASGIDGRVTTLSPFATTADTAISPNETAWFQIPLKANPAPGTYNEYFNLVKEGVTWFTDLGIFFPLTVTP